uniref:Uncharacterized protein n=1 Tax=Anguilla anguilla TaxID=7936 RepID=A0A0E9QB07_ANGAN
MYCKIILSSVKSLSYHSSSIQHNDEPFFKKNVKPSMASSQYGAAFFKVGATAPLRAMRSL